MLFCFFHLKLSFHYSLLTSKRKILTLLSLSVSPPRYCLHAHISLLACILFSVGGNNYQLFFYIFPMCVLCVVLLLSIHVCTLNMCVLNATVSVIKSKLVFNFVGCNAKMLCNITIHSMFVHFVNPSLSMHPFILI